MLTNLSDVTANEFNLDTTRTENTSVPNRTEGNTPKVSRTTLAAKDAKGLTFTKQASGILPRVNASLILENSQKKVQVSKAKGANIWKKKANEP